MANQSVGKKVLGGKALELVMRDVLCGMEDLASRFGYDVTPYRVEILSIDPERPRPVSTPPATTAVVIAFPQREVAERYTAQRKKIS